MFDNSKRYKATLHNTLPAMFNTDDVEVFSTRHHPNSSYGQQVWIDKDGNSYGQINMPMIGWDIIKVDEVTEEEADSFFE